MYLSQIPLRWPTVCQFYRSAETFNYSPYGFKYRCCLNCSDKVLSLRRNDTQMGHLSHDIHVVELLSCIIIILFISVEAMILRIFTDWLRGITCIFWNVSLHVNTRDYIPECFIACWWEGLYYGIFILLYTPTFNIYFQIIWEFCRKSQYSCM